jgi:plasmid stability protein
LPSVTYWGTMRDEMKSRKPAKQANISITGVPGKLLAELREDAKRNHRSLAGHIRAILEHALESRETEAAR